MSCGKRLLDITISGVGLILCSIPMAVIAPAIKLTSRGPVFYRQERVGKHGKLFRVYKLRTMHVVQQNASTVTVAGDSRITLVGRFLRAWKLDEFPQLINVFTGDMSLVGPRPDVPGYADKLKGSARDILQLRPGITGPSTLAFADEELLLQNVEDPLRYNNEVIFPKKVKLNMEYLDRCSLAVDLGYLFKTAMFLMGRLRRKSRF